MYVHFCSELCSLFINYFCNLQKLGTILFTPNTGMSYFHCSRSRSIWLEPEPELVFSHRFWLQTCTMYRYWQRKNVNCMSKVKNMVAEQSHFEGSGSRAPKTGSSSGSYGSTAPALTWKKYDTHFDLGVKVFLCIILCRSRCRRSGSGSWLC